MKALAIKLRRTMLFVGLPTALLLLNCGKDDTAGNTMETENSIALRVYTEGGAPAAQARIALRPLWYLPDTAMEQRPVDDGILDWRTDSDGKILLEHLPAGDYMLRVGSDSAAALLQFSIPLPDSQSISVELTLLPTSTIEGQIPLSNGIPYAWVQILGLEQSVRTDSEGFFALPSVPAGELRLLAWSPLSASALAEQDIEIQGKRIEKAGLLDKPTLATENQSCWRYKRNIDPSTLLSDWMQPLVAPMVVTMRLDRTNFDFSQALPDGRDLRIDDHNGNSLDFERALWDAKAQRGVLNIRVESLSDTIGPWQMRWGRFGALDAATDVWNGIPDSLYLALNSIQIDDFEHLSDVTGLPEPIPRSWWYTRWSDTSVNMSPEPGTGFASAMQPAGLGRAGHAAHIEHNALMAHWVLMGTTLGSGPRDLRALDSIVLWIRGDGRYSVSLDNNHRMPWSKTWVSGDMDSVWSRVRLRPQDFAPATDTNGGNRGWDAAIDSITNFSVFATSGTEMWVDDIRLYGVNRDDLK